MARIVFILGGTKTGKTGFAQTGAAEAVRKEGAGVGYLATARILDDEMAARVRRHRQDRPSDWITVEEPLDLTGAFRSLSGRTGAVILDCLTLYMTNLLSDPGAEEPDRDRAMRLIGGELEALFREADSWKGSLFILSNLVENGLVSVYPFARAFQDVAGMTHQMVARRADEVYQMTAGIPVRIK